MFYHLPLPSEKLVATYLQVASTTPWNHCMDIFNLAKESWLKLEDITIDPKRKPKIIFLVHHGFQFQELSNLGTFHQICCITIGWWTSFWRNLLTTSGQFLHECSVDWWWWVISSSHRFQSLPTSEQNPSKSLTLGPQNHKRWRFYTPKIWVITPTNEGCGFPWYLYTQDSTCHTKPPLHSNSPWYNEYENIE